jgi:hypothetical protein
MLFNKNLTEKVREVSTLTWREITKEYCTPIHLAPSVNEVILDIGMCIELEVRDVR